jgi:hypothetical protein
MIPGRSSSGKSLERPRPSKKVLQGRRRQFFKAKLAPRREVGTYLAQLSRAPPLRRRRCA